MEESAQNGTVANDESHEHVQDLKTKHVHLKKKKNQNTESFKLWLFLDLYSRPNSKQDKQNLGQTLWFQTWHIKHVRNL